MGKNGFQGVYHFLRYWLLEALRVIRVKADTAYFWIGFIPKELGCDVLIHSEFHWDFYKRYRDERHVLDAFIMEGLLACCVWCMHTCVYCLSR